MTHRLPSPPRHLSTSTKQWWKTIVAKFELDGSGLKILTLAGESLDRANEAREILLKDGLVFTDRWGVPKKHPACSIELDNTLGFARLMKGLGLPSEEPATPVPGTRSHKKGKP